MSTTRRYSGRVNATFWNSRGILRTGYRQSPLFVEADEVMDAASNTAIILQMGIGDIMTVKNEWLPMNRPVNGRHISAVLAQMKAEIFALGYCVVHNVLPLSEAGVQVGDVVMVTTDQVLGPGVPSGSQVFKGVVIRKRPDLENGNIVFSTWLWYFGEHTTEEHTTEEHT